MATVGRLIDALAMGLAEVEAFADEPITREYLRQENERGWTIDLPAPLGGTLRYEQVEFDARGLERLYQRVLDYANKV